MKDDGEITSGQARSVMELLGEKVEYLKKGLRASCNKCKDVGAGLKNGYLDGTDPSKVIKVERFSSALYVILAMVSIVTEKHQTANGFQKRVESLINEQDGINTRLYLKNVLRDVMKLLD